MFLHFLVHLCIEISINKKWPNELISHNAEPNIQFFRMLDMVFSHPVRINIRPVTSTIVPFHITIQYESYFVRENNIL